MKMGKTDLTLNKDPASYGPGLKTSPPSHFVNTVLLNSVVTICLSIGIMYLWIFLHYSGIAEL